MKRLLKIIITSFVAILVILICSIYIFISLRSKAIISSQLAKVFRKDITISTVKLENPFLLSINGLKIKDTLKIDKIYVSPSIPGLITGNIVLNKIKIVNPEFIIEKQSSSPIEMVSEGQQERGHPLKGKKDIHLIIKHLNIKDGRLRFIDRTAGKDSITIVIEKMNLDLDNFYVYPKSMITNFTLDGVVPWGKDSQEGKVNASGWFNVFKKDIQAKVKVENIDAVYLAPYYSAYVSLEKARIQQAKLNFSADIQGHDNDVVTACHLELTDIAFKPREGEEEDKTQKLVSAAMSIFKAVNGKIVLDFTFHTKMDRPMFGFENIKEAIEEKVSRGIEERKFNLDDLLGTPGKLLSGTLIGAKDVSKSILTGIGRVFTDPFKRSNGKKPEEK